MTLFKNVIFLKKKKMEEFEIRLYYKSELICTC